MSSRGGRGGYGRGRGWREEGSRFEETGGGNWRSDNGQRGRGGWDSRGAGRGRGGGRGSWRGGSGPWDGPREERRPQRTNTNDIDFLRVSAGIVGTCQEVERNYIRVQSQPDPATVRPEPILRQALEAVRRREEQNEPYQVCKDFYMSICQDLRLQQLTGPLAIQAREAFACCAIRAGIKPRPPDPDNAQQQVAIRHLPPQPDVGALSDCLLHLLTLYELNPGQLREEEFAVYRVVLWAGLSLQNPQGDAAIHLNCALLSLLSPPSNSPAPPPSGDASGDPAPPPASPSQGDSATRRSALAQFASRLVGSIFAEDACCYFSVLAAAPSTAPESRRLAEALISPHMRDGSLGALLKAYRAPVPLSALQPRLGLHAPEAVETYLEAKGAVLDRSPEGGLGPSLDVLASKGKPDK